MKRTDEYFAGLFDGEGNAKVYTLHGIENGKVYPRTKPLLQVGMTDELTIQALKAHFGCGNIVAYDPGKYDPKRAHYKRTYRWSCCYYDAIDVAKRLLPYAITKRDALMSVIAREQFMRARRKKKKGEAN